MDRVERTKKNNAARVARARSSYRRRALIANFLDSTLTAGAKHLKMCGEGKHNGWSVLFAQMWFTDCPCCLFYRGAFFGLSLGAFIVALVAAVVALI